MRKMNNKIPILLTLVLLGNITWLKAQFNPEAQTYLDKAVKVLHESSGLEMDYVISEVTATSDMPFSEGKLFIKSDLYKLVSDEMMVYFDGKEQWVYNVLDKEVMVQTMDTAQLDDSNPISVLKSYDKGYKYDIQKETNENVIINMVSQNQFNPYLLVTVKINKVKNEVTSITMLLRDESALRIDLTYVNKNKKLTDDFFNFKKSSYEVADTIDLRN